MPTIPAEDGLYVELREGATQTTNALMEVIKNLQRELAHLRDSNEQLIRARKE